MSVYLKKRPSERERREYMGSVVIGTAATVLS